VKRKFEIPEPYKISDAQWLAIGLLALELALEIPILRETAIKLVTLLFPVEIKGGTVVKISWTDWAEKSRHGEVCGILGCMNKPVVKCFHCGNHYCQEHAFVLGTLGHLRKRENEV